MRGFEVLSAGVLSTFQDAGRKGYADIGLGEAGAMDEFAYNWANKLLGNKYGDVAIEITLGGLKLKAKGNFSFCITGASVTIALDNKPLETYKTYTIKENQTLDIGFASSGVRAYLGVSGGFSVKNYYGSSATNIKEGIGPQKIANKDFLEVKKASYFSEQVSLKKEYFQKLDAPLRVIASYQWDMFEPAQREIFFTNEYEVSAQNDRMGYRLSGEKFFAKQNGIISEPIAYGAIQVPSSGEPIILLKERQTIGGYPKIGTLLPIDCFKLAQKKAGDKIRFEHISLEEAQKLTQEFYNFFLKN